MESPRRCREGAQPARYAASVPTDERLSFAVDQFTGPTTMRTVTASIRVAVALRRWQTTAEQLRIELDADYSAPPGSTIH